MCREVGRQAKLNKTDEPDCQVLVRFYMERVDINATFKSWRPVEIDYDRIKAIIKFHLDRLEFCNYTSVLFQLI